MAPIRIKLVIFFQLAISITLITGDSIRIVNKKSTAGICIYFRIFHFIY